MTLESALGQILSMLEPLGDSEQVPLKSALGRVLAEDIIAPLPLPPFTNSAMDGYALPLQGLQPEQPLTVVGKAMAGHPHAGNVQPGQCVRIFTGAPVPAGCEAVIIQEQVERQGDKIHLRHMPSRGENIRPAGGDVHAGEKVLPQGKPLNAADLGLLASLGNVAVKVVQFPRVAFFSSGDELCPQGRSLPPGSIYESNRYSLYGLLASLPVQVTDLGKVEDQLEQILDHLENAAQSHDVIISSGGASVGESDLLGQALQEAGTMHLWKVAIKPGKPLIFGRIGKAWFFGLPGNPVSVHVTFTQIVRPALWKLAGVESFQPLRLPVVCENDLHKTPGRLEFQRGRLVQVETGQFKVFGLGGQGSHQLKSLSQANCFIILPADSCGIQAGETVIVEPFENWIC